jgi:PKHD-type hydroxylase
VARVLGLAAEVLFEDGRSSAHGQARDVKHNLQQKRSYSDTSTADEILLRHLTRHEIFQNFALPKRITAPVFVRYEPGMKYGSHVDSCVMGEGDRRLRSDLAVTIFLSDPAGYDGGELVLEMDGGDQEIKLEAGEAIVYSANAIHRVAPVTRGVRQVAIAWVQSLVPDERIRAVLFDLYRVMKGLQAGEESLLIAKSYNNPLRIAAQL